MTPFCKNKHSYLVCRCVSILRYDTAALAVLMSMLDRLLDAVIAVWYAIEDIFQVLCKTVRMGAVKHYCRLCANIYHVSGKTTILISFPFRDIN